jgi:hypothetical protein
MQGRTCSRFGVGNRAPCSPVHRQQKSRLRPSRVLQTPRPGGVSDGDSTADQRRLLNELLKRSGTAAEVVKTSTTPRPVVVSPAPASTKVCAPAQVKAACAAWTVQVIVELMSTCTPFCNSLPLVVRASLSAGIPTHPKGHR